MAILSNGKFYGFLCSVKETGQKLANGAKEYVEDFVSGFAGHGWKLWEYVKGKWKLEVDTIVVRETMLVFEMLISKVRAIIGAQAITQGHGKVKSVRLSEDGTEFLIVLEDDEVSIVAHDFVLCQTLTGDNIKLYHVEVASVDTETKTLHIPISEFEQDESGNVLHSPMAGDELVQFGNSQNKARQSAIYLHADETGQPAMDVMFDLDSKNWEDKVKVRVGGEIPGSNGLRGFYSVNGLIKGVDNDGAVVYEFSPDGTVNIGKGNIVYNPTTNKVTLGSGVTLTWDNLDDGVKENLKGEKGDKGDQGVPGEGGKDANLLDWVQEYEDNKTQIGDEFVISPKMFSGTRDSATGNMTGVAVGRGVVYCYDSNGDKILNNDGTPKTRTGIFGLKNGDLTFELDSETGDVVYRGKVETQKLGNRIIIDPESSQLKMMNSQNETVFSLSFNEENGAVLPFFYIQGFEYGEFVPCISITGRKINGSLYYSKGGYHADTLWGITEDGIHHTKDNQGFSLKVDLPKSRLSVGGGSSFDAHLTRFSPGFLPGYNAAKTGEVYVTTDGILKIKGYSVDS